MFRKTVPPAPTTWLVRGELGLGCSLSVTLSGFTSSPHQTQYLASMLTKSCVCLSVPQSKESVSFIFAIIIQSNIILSESKSGQEKQKRFIEECVMQLPRRAIVFCRISGLFSKSK